MFCIDNICLVRENIMLYNLFLDDVNIVLLYVLNKIGIL